MDDNFNNYSNQQPPLFGGMGAQAVESERTLSNYVARVMRRVFGKMFLGILVTAFVSLFVASQSGIMMTFLSHKWLMFGLIIVEFGLVIAISAGINKFSSSTASVLFYLYAVVTGLTLTPIFLIYTGADIIKTFFITSVVFGVMAAYGYITKRDLSRMGSIFLMALIGLLVVSIVNIFMASSTLDWIVSIAGVAIFIGITAWDTQKIRLMAEETDPSMVGKLATIGALELYLHFINLFLYLLRIFSRDS